MPALLALARDQQSQRGTEILASTAGHDAARFPTLALVAVTLVFLLKAWVHVSVIHMAIAQVSSLALMGVLVRPVPGRGAASRALLAVSLVAAAGFTLSWCFAGLSEAARNLAWVTGPAVWAPAVAGVPPRSGSCRMPAGLERMACFPIKPADAETVRYVEERTAPGDPVFVGLSRHDKIFINDVLLYFIMNRRPVTKWFTFDPGLQTTAPIQRAMIRDLEQARPKLIVIEDIWADWREPNDSAISSGVTLLDDYIRRAYEPVAAFGVNTIMRPVSSANRDDTPTATPAR